MVISKEHLYDHLLKQKIRIVHLQGEDRRYDGKEGIVTYVDSIGQLHGTWGGLAVIPEIDEFQII